MEQGLDADEGILWLFVRARRLVAAGVLLVPVITRHTRSALARWSRPVLAWAAPHASWRRSAAVTAWPIGLASLPVLIATMAGISWFTPPGRARTIDPSPRRRARSRRGGSRCRRRRGVRRGHRCSRHLGTGPPGVIDRSWNGPRLPPASARWGASRPQRPSGTRMALEPRHRVRPGTRSQRPRSAWLSASPTVVGCARPTVADLDHLRSTPRLGGVELGCRRLPRVAATTATPSPLRRTPWRGTPGVAWSVESPPSGRSRPGWTADDRPSRRSRRPHDVLHVVQHRARRRSHRRSPTGRAPSGPAEVGAQRRHPSPARRGHR